VYPQWGWGTDDSEQALTLLKKFGSVTVLNGHIHQTMQKIEGTSRFIPRFRRHFRNRLPAPRHHRPMTVDARASRVSSHSARDVHRRAWRARHG